MGDVLLNRLDLVLASLRRYHRCVIGQVWMRIDVPQGVLAQVVESLVELLDLVAQVVFLKALGVVAMAGARSQAVSLKVAVVV